MADWTLILWRRNGPEDFAALAAEGYRLFSLFREGEGGPAFETVWNRSQAKLFPWTEEAFAGTLRKGQTKQGNLLLGDLGYSVSFFSGGERPVGYRLHTGDRKGLDACVVPIPEERQRGAVSPERWGLSPLLGLRGCGAGAGGRLPGGGWPSCPLLAELLAGADGPNDRKAPHPPGLCRDRGDMQRWRPADRPPAAYGRGTGGAGPPAGTSLATCEPGKERLWNSRTSPTSDRCWRKICENRRRDAGSAPGSGVGGSLPPHLPERGQRRLPPSANRPGRGGAGLSQGGAAAGTKGRPYTSS